MKLTNSDCKMIMKQIGCMIKALNDLHMSLLILKEQNMKKNQSEKRALK